MRRGSYQAISPDRLLLALAEAGKSIKEITRSTGRSRKLVRSVLRGRDGDVFRCRQSMLEPYIAKLRVEWDATAATARSYGGEVVSLRFRPKRTGVCGIQ